MKKIMALAIVLMLAGCATVPVVGPITSGEKVRVFAFYGLGGAVTSPGVDQIADTLRGYAGITVEGPYAYESWSDLEDAMRATPRTIKIVTLGYSCGNQSLTGLPAYNTDVPVALAVGIQASLYCPPYALTPNIAAAQETYNPNCVETFGLGCAEYQPGPGFPSSRLHIIQRPDSHGEADLDPDAQQDVVTAVLNVLQAKSILHRHFTTREACIIPPGVSPKLGVECVVRHRGERL